MQTIKRSISTTCGYDFTTNYLNEELLFFDIETTGFAADVTSLYLIGCIYYKNNAWQLIQWFADDYESEEMVLSEFLSFSNQFSVLIHYNGTGFDLPYLKKKCEQYNLLYDLTKLTSLDLYKKITPYKAIIPLKNYKQKTVEQFLFIKRTDRFSGGELITVYGEFLKSNFFQKEKECEQLRNQLLLHNEEDLTGLLQLTELLYYTDLFEQPHTIKDCTISDSALTITAFLPHPLKQVVTYKTEHFTLHAQEETASVTVSVYEGELKYFFENYKDYYYLEKEDMAIHKSVASYVDKEFRKKAKASNCYMKKAGTFLPQWGDLFTPYFRKDYHDTCSYFEQTDDFIKNKEQIRLYFLHLMKNINS